MTRVYTKKSIVAISVTQCQKLYRCVDLKSRDICESLLQDYNDIWVLWRATCLLLNVGLTVLGRPQLMKLSI